MQLSFSLRLVCLLLASVGIVQLMLEYLAWRIAPYLVRQAASPRRAERVLFLLALLARLGPWLAVAVWAPAYLRAEDNLAGERVGLVCITAAVVVLGACLWQWLCALEAWFRVRHLRSLCRETGQRRNGLPLLLYPGERLFLAVVGVFRSTLVVSESLLAAGRLSADALESAFRHEAAHARHRDNLKLLVLSVLPQLPLGTAKRPSLEQQWRLAAEMAADVEGAQGRPDHAILLAELLVIMARDSTRHAPAGVFALRPRAEDLAARVDRLLEGSAAAADLEVRGVHLTTVGCALAVGAALITTLSLLCTQMIHHAAEMLLRLG